MNENYDEVAEYDDHQCCEVMYINGIKCHEQGCSESWRDEIRNCRWCGSAFIPEEKGQTFCDEECAECYGF